MLVFAVTLTGNLVFSPCLPYEFTTWGVTTI